MKKHWNADQLIDFEDYIKQLFSKGKINVPIHLSGGNEEQLISIFKNIKDKDYVFSTHRSHYHYLLKGGSSKGLIDELLGKKSGVCGGKAGSMHLTVPALRFYASAIIGGTCGIACGVGISIKKKWKKRKGTPPHVWCFVGDGCEDTGHFVEAVRFTSTRGLPVTFIVEDNDLAVSTTKNGRWGNYAPINNRCIIRYSYKRTYPHVGIGQHVSM